MPHIRAGKAAKLRTIIDPSIFKLCEVIYAVPVIYKVSLES